MRPRVLFCLLSLMILSAALPALAADRVFGKGVSQADTMLISVVLANPEQHVGQTVRVAGTVVGVCKMRGCWMDLASDREHQTIKIKVDDGVIVFPMDLMGEVAVAEGVLAAIPLDLEASRAYMSKEASCQGEEFDPASITAPITIYQIEATGAVAKTAAPPPAAAGQN